MPKVVPLVIGIVLIVAAAICIFIGLSGVAFMTSPSCVFGDCSGSIEAAYALVVGGGTSGLIGAILLVYGLFKGSPSGRTCLRCGYQSGANSVYCERCGSRLN